MRGRDQEHYPTASSNLHTLQFCGDTGSLKLWPVTTFGLSWWCVLNCTFLLMSKPSAGSSELNICDVKVDLYLSSSSLLSLDGLYCNNYHSQQEIQVASLGGLWPKLPPGSSQQPSPAVAAKKIDPSIYSQYFLGMAKSAEGWCQTCQSMDHSSDSWPAGSSTSASHKWPASRQTLPTSQLASSSTRTTESVCLGLGATTSTYWPSPSSSDTIVLQQESWIDLGP